MKRSVINRLIRSAQACYQSHGWTLPPNPRWDVTDFGLGDWRRFGLVLVNLAEEPEYCEKLMYAQKGMTTPAHCHQKKKEDIICRWGRLAVRVWAGPPDKSPPEQFILAVNHEFLQVQSNQVVALEAGSRVTLVPGIYHEFYPLSDECIIGEVSTANDDLHDNYFANGDVGRYPGVEEDEPAIVRLLGDKPA
ncbi:MAG TPA: D-lyxose/D-mannose family sugar isomerase [Verrucomicrobiae bacterium]|nr:D-lyxose/D-mannose family sugar isomerase [Verrucomicrobiae bacterium]